MTDPAPDSDRVRDRMFYAFGAFDPERGLLILGHCAFHTIVQGNLRMVEAILDFLVKPSHLEPWTLNDPDLMKLYISGVWTELSRIGRI